MVAHLVASTAASKAELMVEKWVVSSAVVRVGWMADMRAVRMVLTLVGA